MNSNWQQIILALILGATVGVLLSYYPDNSISQILLNILTPVGKLFINAIKMMIVPVVFVSIVCGVISFKDPKMLGRIGLKTITIYIATMCIAVIVGLVFAKLLNPGLGFDISHSQSINITLGNINSGQSISDLIISIIPDNPAAAFANANILQIVIFAIIFGIAMMVAGKPALPMIEFFKNLLIVVEQIPRLVLSFAPIGIFALIASVTAEFGLNALLNLIKAVATIYIGCFFQLIIVFSIILRVFLKLSPRQFYKGMMPAITFAFSTTSSAATIPYTSKCAHKNLGVSNRFVDFIIPLGATINMNGLSVYLGVVTVFACNVFQIELSIWQYIMVIFTGTLAAIGAAGVPGSALIVMSLVLSTSGLPTEAIAVIIALFAGVDRIIDMCTTIVNISGDALTSMLVAKSENDLDELVYNKTVSDINSD